MIPYALMTPKQLRAHYAELRVAMKVEQAKLAVLLGLPEATKQIDSTDAVFAVLNNAKANADEIASLVSQITEYKNWLIEIADLLVPYAG